MAINVDVLGNTQPLEAAVQSAVNRIRRRPIKITVDDKGATQPLGNMRRSADEFSKSMEAANARIIAFGASMAIINGVADAFKGMVRNVVEVEKALADINVVMGLSAQNLERFSDGLFTVAKETGQAFKIAADAATEYARQGLSMEESLKRTKDALILTRLTGMDSANAVKSLTAAMNTYGNQIKDTTQLVSKFAAVDVKFAVSAEDFADAIARTGAAAKGAGVDIDELIGLVTAAQQQTARGGKVIGNSFKTIFTRIGRTDTLNQLENLGIAVRDIEGNTLGAKRILTDLANTFDSLTEAQKAQIAQTVGGVFQINVLKAVLGDAAKQNGILANATQISAGATDEAITKNEQLRQTMSAMATETGLAIKEVSAKIGEIALAPGMEKILNVVKSVAEGANNLLGDGESAGGKFANGFLKGLGNIITGPGLVVIVAVFGKLFLKAAQYARESLTSLIGVTTEAQKQKAIQTSLVNLFGQNAALSKEMLRTDISRTEKEKIILALLRAQVAEANTLNAISKQAASTLYRQGFGPNLAPRRGRADGHIPNFAEREQAAKGGYAAGNIRTMNMPGQGSVIYNSAEKVKNFAGMKQPAIMPPLSSKAGKNYQQAFGSVHGFDPYAGSGFVPNFNKPTQKISTASGPQLNGINFAHMLTPGGGSSTVTAKPENSIYGIPVKDLPYVKFNQFGIRRDASTKAENKKKDIAQQIEEAVTKNATKQGVQLINSFKLGTGQKATPSDVRKKLTSGASGASGAINSVVGALFEAAISTKIRQVTKKGFEQSGGIKGVAQGLGGDFDLRGPLSDDQKNDLKLMFGGSWSSTNLADYKSTNSPGNQKSMAEKILKEKIFRLGGRKTTDPALAFVKERMPQLGDKNKRVLGPRMGFSGRGPRLNGEGYIPNFANPLSDAINREKGAGVPVSQIRVGSHQALMNKGNPLGLGVTNTTDEPNGLRDVFGANGYVPNYAFTEDDFKNANRMPGAPSIKRADGQFAKLADVADKANKDLKKLTKAFLKGKINKDQFNRGIKDISSKYKLNAQTTQRVTQAQHRSIGVIGRLNASRNRASLSFQQSSMGAVSGKMGKMFGGNAGMMMMMGAPMAAGFLQSDGPGQGGAAYAAGGALTGAASGGMMASMVAPMFGPAAPLVIGVGALLGGVKGLTAANEENTKALKERQQKDAQQLAGLFGSIPINLSQEQIDEVNKVVETTVGPRKQNERRHGRQNAEIDRLNNRRNAEARKAAILESLKKVNIDEQFAIDAPQFVDGAMKRDKDKNIVMSAQKMDRDQMSKMVEKMPIGDEGVQDALEDYYNLITKNNVETSVAQSKEAKAIILRLNLQKAITLAQQEAKVAQIDIKQKYFEQANMLDAQTKILGGLISEEQKARLSYNKSLLKNAETREAGERAAEDAMRLGILQDIKGSQAAGLEQELKRVLFKGEDANKLQDITFKELTDKLDTKSAQELLNIILEISETNGDAKEIAEQRTAQLESQVSVLDKQKTLSDNIASAEYKTNDAMSKRKDTLKDINQEMDLYLNKVKHEGELRTIRSEIQSARFSAGPSRTMSEIFANDRRLVGERQQGLREDYQKSGRSLIKSAADRMDLSQQERLQVINDPKELKTFQAKRIEDIEKEFIKKGGSSYIETLTQNTKARETELGEFQKESDEYRKYYQKDFQDAQKTQVKELQKLKELKILQQSLNDAKSEESKNVEKITTELDRQLEITNEKISKEETLQDIKEKEYLRKTGPGAAMEGFSDGMTDMRKKIAMMDYELTKSIPDKLASGLATAMTEAANGAKNIGDALEDAALSFLSYMQQAMMQKLAMQAVGALGFSQGGGVRKYSSGGNVPAMVTNGEYVMGRQAVKKYGGGFMHSLNARGKIPNYSMGGDTMQEYGMGKIPYMSRGGEPGSALAANFGGGESFVSGRNYQSRAMSGFFYSGQAGNVGLQEDTQEFKGILQKREEERRRREMERQAKKAKRRKILGMIGSIAASYALGSIFSGGGFGAPGSPGNSWQGSTNLAPGSAGEGFAFAHQGGPINKYAAGGMIYGKSGIDQIPAMLSEGEYVIKASSARQMGKPMLDRINAGKFYEGGSVSPEAQKEESSVSGGQTNNISINIKMDGSGNKQESSETTSDSQGDTKRENQAEMGKKIKDAVIGVIVEEKRPGGLLSET